jgi:hypothetical protein
MRKNEFLKKVVFTITGKFQNCLYSKVIDLQEKNKNTTFAV